MYALAFCNRKLNPFRLACGSFKEDVKNTVDIITLNQEEGGFDKICSFEHDYPPTKIMWLPEKVINLIFRMATETILSPRRENS